MAFPQPGSPPRKRGFAAGIMTIGTGAGLSIVGIILPGLLAGPEGWRHAWFLLGAPGLRLLLRLLFVAYLIDEAALLPRKAGGMFALLGLVSILGGALWGWVSDGLGRRYGVLLAPLTLAFSCLLFAVGGSLPPFYASAVLFGVCLSSLPPIMAAAVGDVLGGRLAPAGLGFVTLIFGIGQSLGPAAAGWIKDATGTFAWAFILAAAVSAAGAGGAMMLRKKD